MDLKGGGVKPSRCEEAASLDPGEAFFQGQELRHFPPASVVAPSLTRAKLATPSRLRYRFFRPGHLKPMPPPVGLALP